MNLSKKWVALILSIILLPVLIYAAKVYLSDAVKKNAYILSINGQKYSVEDFYAHIFQSLLHMEEEALVNVDIKDSFINDFIEGKLLYEAAMNAGTIIDQDRLNDVLSSFVDEQSGDDLERFSGISEDLLRYFDMQVNEMMYINKYLQREVNDNIYIGERELKEYYDANRERFAAKTSAKIYHIITDDEESIKSAYDELSRGYAFSDVAFRYSKGMEKSVGGDLGYMDADSLPPFFDVAFKLKEGSYSEVVKSDYGYHIFKLGDKVSSAALEFEEVMGDIYEIMYIRKYESMAEDVVQNLWDNAKIVYIDVDLTLYDILKIMRPDYVLKPSREALQEDMELQAVEE